ncbi:GntR family transcriptional regulator [Streptomyces sp. LP05-1]|uniref:GntR family transcriptional regulator n=1 Tax=Streptomyces pyxinae TaxID=2970734 RepID=A0ABT2CHF2_9ACTN|nr:GntR family transcriptional regulator [Streptomyces sp. LP05-1]MCS0636831.1 GntR family transcriptional regulator [Streptomyces sp. LP05-1]
MNMAESHAAEPQISPVLPLYLRVAAALRDDLAQRRIPPGARLPAERTLVHRFQVNRQTVRNALRLLRDEGLVVTERRGTFAAGAAGPRPGGPALAGDLLRFPYGPGTAPGATGETLLAWEPAPAELADRLGVPAGEPTLTHGHRVLDGDGAPVQRAATRFSRHALTEVAELARYRRRELWPARPDLGPLYHWMHRAGLRLTRRESITVTPGPATAACLTVHREVTDQHGHVLELTDLRFAPGQARWTYEFSG